MSLKLPRYFPFLWRARSNGYLALTRTFVSVTTLKPPSGGSTTATAYFFNGTTDGLGPVLHFGEHKSNLRTPQSQKVWVEDLRALEPRATLAKVGCEFLTAPTNLDEKDLKSEDLSVVSLALSRYYAECETLVRARTGGTRAVAYHHRHREQRQPTGAAGAGIHDVQDFSSRPVATFHVDNDAATAERNLRRAIGDNEAERDWLVDGKHWGILNVWRPLGEMVRQWPLALLDSRTYELECCNAAVPIATLGNYKKHFIGLRALPDYRFYYVKNMRPEEALIFIDYDSASTSAVSGLGHGAVQDHNSPPNAPLRRSLEVRVLVLYD